ncbi:fasciclin domain-containing protein [Proteocatella sphenisci]|uniref:fasciclin domain-containing protein n=1 Tax=Proteocatella sphenisci TaxID=181070 RepID=UPI0004B1129D|nr:fasciclin domain-containing protein [Proteocatella sphenisci]
MKKRLGIVMAFMMIFSSFSSLAVGNNDGEGAITYNGVKMFPLRTVAMLIKADVKWDNTQKAAVMMMEGKTVTFKAGQNQAMVNDKNMTLKNMPYLKNGKMYISESSLMDIWEVGIEYVDGKATLKNMTKMDIVDTAVAAGSFDTLVAAVKAAGLVDTLKGEGPFTVFAPTDAAFAKLPKGTVENLLMPENKAALIDILTYHVVAGDKMAADVVKMDKIKMLNGKDAMIEIKDGKAMIDGATITMTDIVTSNGVIHVIDAVMLPEAKMDIVDTAVAAGDFKTLVAAVKAAGLVDTLKGEGPFTVFAPTVGLGAAFAKLPKGTVEDLLMPENKAALIDILTYHAVAGDKMAADVVKMDKIKMLNGKDAMIEIKDGKAMIDGATITMTDIVTSNGVIHVIDTVMLP